MNTHYVRPPDLEQRQDRRPAIPTERRTRTHPVLDRIEAGAKLTKALIRLALWGTIAVILLVILIAGLIH